MKSLLKKTSKKEKDDINKTTIVIDCSSLTYAARYSMGVLSYNGRPTGVIYGFLRRILSYAEKFKTNDFIFCWDSSNSIRKKIYPEYKKTREKRRKEATASEKAERIEMISQTHILCDQIIPSLGFKNNFEQNGFEADDLLAYWSMKLKKKNILVTSDNDLYQCLHKKCNIFSPATKKLITAKKIYDKFGIYPQNWALAKAIGGCDGDNVQGIKGASDPKNNPNSLSLKYLRGELKSGKIFDRIENGEDIIKRNLQLVKLPCPLGKLKKMLKRRNKFNRKAFIKVFDENHFISMLEDKVFKKWEGIFNIAK